MAISDPIIPGLAAATAFDLDTYLARIALAERPTCNADGLHALQRAHRLAIPFDALDARLGRRIDIGSDAVFAKLVLSRRGGYCFEQDRLLRDALAALGFAARPLLARTRLGVVGVQPLTHTLSLVALGDGDWIADAGFGGSYSPPMPLVDGAEATAVDGACFRLEARSDGWVLLRNGPAGSTDGRGAQSGWVEQYVFDVRIVEQTDLEMSNWWTSASPHSRFVQNAIASIVLPNGFASLNGRRYRRRAGDNETAAEIGDPRVYRMRLSLMFGIDLSADEVAALDLF